jgi:hypothetical protein
MTLIDPSEYTAMRRVYEQHQDSYLTEGSIVYAPGTPGVTYRVLKVNPKNVSLSDVEGKHWRLRRVTAELAPVGTKHAEIVKEQPTVKVGSIVRFKGNTGLRFGTEYRVCIKAPDERGRAKFATLGGGTAIYTTLVENCELIELADVVAG